MSYIGNKPTVGNFQICDAISVVNGQAAYTMQVGSVNVIPQSANHMIVSLNGTIQKPGSSFTVSGSTITFASNLATGDAIDFIQILGDVLDLGVPSDATVTAAKLGANSVTAAKLNNDIISGATALTSEPADTDEFLVSDAGTLKRIDYSLIKGGGCWEKLDTITISGNTSQIEHEEANFTSTHRDYKIMLSNVGLTADATIRMRIAPDGGTLLSSTDYKYAMTSYRSDDSTATERDQDGVAFPMGGATASGGNASYSQNFEINLYHPLSTATYFHFSSVGMQIDNNDYAMTNVGSGVFVAQDGTAMKRFVLYLSTGDFNAGTSTLYGRIA